MILYDERRPDVRAASVQLLFRQLPVALAANAINSTLVALVLARVEPTGQILFWWMAMLVVVSARTVLWWSWKRRGPSPPEQLEPWERWMFFGALAAGTLWGISAFLLFPEQEFYQIFLAFVIGGMAAGAAISLSYSLPTFFAFLLPSVLPLAARFLIAGTATHVAMGAMALLFTLALALFARNQHAVLTGALAVQIEKSLLADELAELLQNLEQRVEERTNELRVANEKLIAEIAERQRAEEAERQARAEAERANIAKSTFLAAASHDLRQPIQSLRFYLDALNMDLTTENQRTIAAQMSMILDNTLHLLDTLLDLSALETGKIQPAVRPCKLQDLIDPIVDEFRLVARQKGLQLRVRPCAAEVVPTDPVLFSRMLRNLVINAIRHTPTGKVLIACRRRQDHIRVEVWDTGTGVPEEKLKAIFNAFYRLDTRPQILGKGMGLGLWIVTRTAKLLRHEVEVKSRPGHGSMFAIKMYRQITSS